jgi:hypothetical protein
MSLQLRSQRNSLHFLLYKSSCGPQSRSGRYEEKKILLSLPGMEHTRDNNKTAREKIPSVAYDRTVLSSLEDEMSK